MESACKTDLRVNIERGPKTSKLPELSVLQKAAQASQHLVDFLAQQAASKQALILSVLPV